MDIKSNDQRATKVYEEVLSKQNHLVVEANDLAKSFGNLERFEHQMLDFCVSYIKKDSRPDEIFTTHISSILKHFGLTKSGTNYERIARALKKMKEKTGVNVEIIDKDGRERVRLTQVFDYVDIYKDGQVDFLFSKSITPYLFELKQRYFSFHLGELSMFKGKYTFILLKLWEANRIGKARKTTIEGSMDEWQTWFLGTKEVDGKQVPRRMSAGQFLRDVIKKAVEELEEKYNILGRTVLEFSLEKKKDGRKIIGYTLEITDNRQIDEGALAAFRDEIEKEKKEKQRIASRYDPNEEGMLF